MRTCEKAQQTLERMLPANCSFTEFWDTYRQFSQMEFEDDNYMIISDVFEVEFDKHDDPSRDFYFDVVRMFSFVDNTGEYSGREQLVCSLNFNEAFTSTLGDRFRMWCGDFDGDVDKLFETVESLPFFAKATRHRSFLFSIMATGV